MKNLLQNLEEVEKILKENKNIGLFLDFDGTLSAIAKTPQKAYLPLQTKKLLVSLQNKTRIFLAIISGRKLQNIKNKIDINGIVYSGNHGLEWEINGKKESVVVSKNIFQALFYVKEQLQKLEKQFKEISIESKGLTIAIHYRLLKDNLKEFKKAFAQIIKPYLDHKLTVIKGKKVFDIRPDINWTKGHFLKFLTTQISKEQGSEIFPIYIGDDKTDEDVFVKLKNGITIKVGKNLKSKARYYLKDTQEVFLFLKWFNDY